MQMGFGTRKRLLKFRSHHSPEARDSFTRLRKINKYQKRPSQRFSPSKIPLGCLGRPALRSHQCLPGCCSASLPWDTTTEAVSRPGPWCSPQSHCGLKPKALRAGEGSFLNARGMWHIRLGEAGGSGWRLTTELPGPHPAQKPCLRCCVLALCCSAGASKARLS